MWDLDHKEGWVPKNWCFWTVVLEKTLESPLDCKQIKPVHPKGNQSWILIGRTDVGAEAPIFWPPDVKNWLIGKDPDVGKDWRQEEKGTTENEMVGWHDRLDEHEFEQALGFGDGQGSLACWQHMGSRRVGHDWATELNWCAFRLLLAVSHLKLLHQSFYFPTLGSYPEPCDFVHKLSSAWKYKGASAPILDSPQPMRNWSW